MKRFRQADSGDRGWFVGPFERAVYKTSVCEVAHQFNYKGENGPAHTHRIATEINLVTSGRVEINGEIFTDGEGYIMYPGDVCRCNYLENTYTLVVKIPGVLGDKYLL